MNTRTASHKRVARSWLLDKLFGKKEQQNQEKGVKQIPAKTLSQREREKVLDDSYEEIKRAVELAIQSQIGAMNSTEKRIAKKYGIDPTFLNWYVVSGKQWPSMPAKTRDALRAMQSIRVWFGAVPSGWSNMRTPPPEKARSRDAALKELGETFLKQSVTRIERKYADKIWKKSRQLQNIFQGPGGPKNSNVSLYLMQDFERRLKGDRFQKKPAVRRVVELFD